MPVSQVGYRKTGAARVREGPDRLRRHDPDSRRGYGGWLGDPAELTLTPEAHAAIEVIEAEIEPTCVTTEHLPT